ncbi:MAG: 6-bladed beta-propeller [Planctomycetota bacterium]|nr:6-bladed beta-propeller [Planctomycetota bacterium]
MKRRTMSKGLGLLVLLAAAGCDPAGQPKSNRVIFYPAPPDLPRLQFLTSFDNVSSWAQPQSNFAEFVVGSSKKNARQGEIHSPYGIAAYGGKLYICDLGPQIVHVIDVINKKYAPLGAPGQLEMPVNITIAPDGTKYVCDTGKKKVAVYDANDQFVRYLGDPKTCVPIALALYKDELIVIDAFECQIEIWDKEGKVLKTFAGKGEEPGKLQGPTNVAVAADGRIFVSDTMGSNVFVFNHEGRIMGTIGAPGDTPGCFARPKGLLIDPNGILYTAEAQWEKIQIFTLDGQLLLFFGEGGPLPDCLGMPRGLAIDTSTIPAFAQYIDKDFQPEYLLFVANQYGKGKRIGVYAFGKSRTADYSKALARPTTSRPATAPAPAPAPLPEPTRTK